MIRNLDEINRRFNAMKRQAIDRVLLVSPPYAQSSSEEAFLSGYETALMDIAKGEIDVPLDKG